MGQDMIHSSAGSSERVEVFAAMSKVMISTMALMDAIEEIATAPDIARQHASLVSRGLDAVSEAVKRIDRAATSLRRWPDISLWDGAHNAGGAE